MITLSSLKSTSPQLLLGSVALLAGGATGILVASTPSLTKLLVIVFGIFFVLMALIQVEWGLIGLTIINYTNLSDVAIKYHGAPSIAQPFIALVVVGILIRWYMHGATPIGAKIPLLIVGAYVLTGLLSPLYSAAPEHAQAVASDYLKFGVVTLLVVMLLQRGETLRRVIWTLLLVGIFLGTISCYQYLTGTFDNNYGGFAVKPVVDITIEGDAENRVTGPIGDPNFYAQTILVLVPLALDRLRREQSWILRALAVWALVVCIGTILATLSRGAFVGLAVVAVLWFMRHPPKPIVLVLAVLGIVALLPFVPARYTNRVDTLYSAVAGPSEERLTDFSVRGRTSEMLAAAMMFADHPVLGVGLGNYNYHYLEYSRVLGIDGRREDRSAHSLYLEIAAERGLIGLAIFGVLLVLMFRSMWQARDALRGAGLVGYADMVDALNIGLTSYMTTSLFLHDAYPRYFWLLVGIALATKHVAQNEIDAQASAHDLQTPMALRVQTAPSSL